MHIVTENVREKSTLIDSFARFAISRGVNFVLWPLLMLSDKCIFSTSSAIDLQSQWDATKLTLQ